MNTKIRILMGALALATATGAQADDYPSRPISLMVSYSPGGATDFQARIVTMMAADAKLLGQPIVIINKAGAGGKVGWNAFADKASTDGYELAAYNVPHFIAQSITGKTKYNIDNLEPIANWGADPAVLIVPKASPFKSAKDLVEFAKKNPGKLTVNGAGLYVGHHIAMLQLQKASATKLAYIPEKGGAPAMKSVIAGQVMAGFNNLSDAFRARDQVRILAIADLERNKDFLPDVPTFREQGIDIDDSSVNFRGVMVRKGTPQAVIDRLAERVPAMFSHPRSLKQMKAGGSPVRVIKRDQVRVMCQERQKALTALLSDLKKK
ncbi:MAG: tripartite tricarboxylate transporter substrate binding protein [Burkholderiaceae bacterium]